MLCYFHDIILIMEICDEGKTNWMGDYFALIGDHLLYIVKTVTLVVSSHSI